MKKREERCWKREGKREKREQRLLWVDDDAIMHSDHSLAAKGSQEDEGRR